jgi:3-hydroxymyristoyl/3-hydroxydecanoyl-(acyl carrier protein) dehydratase
MVFDAIARAGDRKRSIKSVSRVRFKQAIRPDDHLKIIASPKRDDAESYNFRIMHGEEVVCSGVMTFQGSHG